MHCRAGNYNNSLVLSDYVFVLPRECILGEVQHTFTGNEFRVPIVSANVNLGCKMFERSVAHASDYSLTSPRGGRGPIVAMSVISIVEDFICATLPFLVLRNLKISRRQKYALYGIFVLAYGICGCGGKLSCHGQ